MSSVYSCYELVFHCELECGRFDENIAVSVDWDDDYDGVDK